MESSDALWGLALLSGEVSMEEVELFLATFPTSPLVGLCISHLVETGKQKSAQKALKDIGAGKSPFARVWTAYFQFIESTKKTITKEVVTLALQQAGRDPNSGPLWKRRLELCTDFSERRAVYQECTAVPFFGVASMWKEYLEFEQDAAEGGKVVLDTQLKRRHDVAAAVVEHLSQAGLDDTLLPRPPANPTTQKLLFDNQAEQLARWRSVLSFLIDHMGSTNEEKSKEGGDGPLSKDDFVKVVDSHFRRFCNHFLRFDFAWVEAALVWLSLLPGEQGLAAASKVVARGLEADACPSSPSLVVLDMELKKRCGIETKELATALVTKGSQQTALLAFARHPALLQAHKKEFRSIGKAAVASGVSDWGFYQLWLDLERFVLHDETLLQNIVSKGGSKMAKASAAEAVCLSSTEELAALRGNEAQLLELLETGAQSTLPAGKTGDAISRDSLATTEMGAGVHVAAWQRFRHYEATFNGTDSGRLAQLQKRETEVLDKASLQVPSTSADAVLQSQTLRSGLWLPLYDDDVEVHAKVAGLREFRKRKELESQGEVSAPLTHQRISMKPPLRNPLALHGNAEVPAPVCLDPSTSQWKKFTIPTNRVPPNPADDPNSPIPCAPRVMWGNLNRKVVLDRAAVRRQREDADRERKAGEAALEKEARLKATGLPPQLASIIERLPSEDEMRLHAQKFAASSGQYSGLRLMGKVNSKWLVAQLKATDLRLRENDEEKKAQAYM